VTDKTVIISWTVYSGEQPEKIKIQYQVTNSGDWKSIEVAGTATSYNLNGLQPISPYQVQVIVIKEGKESSARQSGLRTNINLGMLRFKTFLQDFVLATLFASVKTITSQCC